MELHKVLTEETIWLDGAGLTKWQVLEGLVGRLPVPGGLEDHAAVLEAVLAREHRSSTGVGGGIAIPHARTDRVPGVSVALAVVPGGMNFESLDHKPCHLVFLVVAPPGASARYLDALASIASIGVSAGHVARLIACASASEVLALLATINGKNRTPQAVNAP
jgi:PTS system fructose-specific IIC component